MKFIENDKDISLTHCENSQITGEHFKKVINSNSEVEWDHLKQIEEQQCVYKLDNALTFKEFDEKFNKLTLHKNLGINGLSSGMIKSLDDYNRSVLCNCIR